jgi:hypothetical protein
VHIRSPRSASDGCRANPTRTSNHFTVRYPASNRREHMTARASGSIGLLRLHLSPAFTSAGRLHGVALSDQSPTGAARLLLGSSSRREEGRGHGAGPRRGATPSGAARAHRTVEG